MERRIFCQIGKFILRVTTLKNNFRFNFFFVKCFLEILNNLVADLNFEELLQCFPNDVIQNRNMELWAKEFNKDCITAIDANIGGLIFEEEEIEQKNLNSQTMKRDHLPMDNVDEDNVFELILRKAVSKQRSIALRSMIESTGKQLFDATSNPMYNL